MRETKKISARRFKPSYFYSVLSTCLVLFMLGILALVFSSGRKLANHFKENLVFQVIIKDNTSEKRILALKDTLANHPWIKSAEYVSKDEAARIFTHETGEDFKDLLDYNPLYASIDVKLYSDYISPDSIANIEKVVTAHNIVSELYYDHKLVEFLNDNIRKIGWAIIGISIVLIIIAITLIDSTIRLSMYANRFLIRSMQLVGATRGFITKPFLMRSIINGFIAAAAAVILLLVLMQFATSQLPELKTLQDVKVIALIFTGILVIGLLFSTLSTRFAVKKYLRMKIDELY